METKVGAIILMDQIFDSLFKPNLFEGNDYGRRKIYHVIHIRSCMQEREFTQIDVNFRLSPECDNVVLWDKYGSFSLKLTDDR